MNNANKIRTQVPVRIPAQDGRGIAETITVEVDAWESAFDGEIYLDDVALEQLDRIKARHMGLLLPSQIKELRGRLSMTQQEMCELLHIGMKTYSRWETGRERPSQFSNLLLKLLYEGRLTLADVLATNMPESGWSQIITRSPKKTYKPQVILGANEDLDPCDEALAPAA